MKHDDLSADTELVQAALITFSAVSLGSIEFLRNAFWRTDGVIVPRVAVVYAIVLMMVVPAAVLFAMDRAATARDKSGRTLRWFRTALFAVALLLILRQLQLYWDPAEDLAHTLRSASVVILPIIGLVAVAAIVLLCVRLFRGVALFFLYMSPVAIAVTAILPFQVPTRNDLPHTYDLEVAREGQTRSGPPVFVLILDELPYEVLVEDGELDTEAYPNFAELAGDGTWFTNATSNYYWSADSIPKTLINPIVDIADQFDVRLYLQFPPIESRYVDECGETYTCRGERYLAQNNRLWLATNLALRSLYEATTDWVETAVTWPVGWLVNPLDTTYPQADPFGYQAFTKKQFDLFVNDIDGQEAGGTIHVLHSLATHWPYSFNENEGAVSSKSSSVIWVNRKGSRKSAMFADSLLGSLISKLKAEGIYEESVVVVTSDHGLRTFSPSPEKPPAQFEIQVPLLIRAPGAGNQISDVDYQHYDFGPTLADILGLAPPDNSKGVSAFSEERPERDKIFFVRRQGYVYSAEDDSWHAIEEATTESGDSR
jgi:hypothetical protein